MIKASLHGLDASNSLKSDLMKNESKWTAPGGHQLLDVEDITVRWYSEFPTVVH